jgi:hypothetical protein
MSRKRLSIKEMRRVRCSGCANNRLGMYRIKYKINYPLGMGEIGESKN